MKQYYCHSNTAEIPALPQLDSQKVIFWNWDTGLETCFFSSQNVILTVVRVVNGEVNNCSILAS